MLSVVLNIMVDKGSLSSCVVIVVVVVIRSLGCGITLAQAQQGCRIELTQTGVR